MDISENNYGNFKLLRDENIDIGIIGKGFISLYYKEDVLNYDVNLLKKKEYKVIEFDGNFISNEDELHFELKEKLIFPDYYGKNYDALSDSLIDYEIDEKGVVLVFKHLNSVNLRIHVLLDILAIHSRSSIATGKKMLTLVQVDDPKFKIIEPIGALNFWLWNDKEWFEGDRCNPSFKATHS